MDMGLPVAAVAMVFTREDPSFLIMERSAHPGDPWSGHLAFPGGKVEAWDMDSLDTAIRETREEVGLKLQREQCSEIRPHAIAGHYSGRKITVAPYLFEIESKVDLELDDREAKRAFWVNIQEFLDPQRHEEEAFYSILEDKFPFFRVDDVRLWGFTYEQLIKKIKWKDIC